MATKTRIPSTGDEWTRNDRDGAWEGRWTYSPDTGKFAVSPKHPSFELSNWNWERAYQTVEAEAAKGCLFAQKALRLYWEKHGYLECPY